MKVEIIELPKSDLKKIAVVGTHLHKWQGNNYDDIQKIINEQAMVQLDPLNPAGRNHDLFFFSRMLNYKTGDFQETVYPQKLVFEAYFPNLMAISKKYFPLFLPQMKKQYLHKYFQSRMEKMEKLHRGILDEAREFLKNNGPSKASDLGELANKKPEFSFWKTSNLAGMALEMLWILGKAAICDRDEHWRKKYDLIENFLDEALLEGSKLSDDEIDYSKFLIKQKSYPLINLGKAGYSSSNKLIFGKKKRLKPSWFENSKDSKCPQILSVEGESFSCGVPADWEKLLESKIDNEMRAIAPLDPLIWDRELTKRIFNFNYTWEVYKIPKDRIYGYYVYPLLYKGEFIGRMEAKFDKKNQNFHLFNFIQENGFDFDNNSEKKLLDLINRWKIMLNAETISKDKTFNMISIE